MFMYWLVCLFMNAFNLSPEISAQPCPKVENWASPLPSGRPPPMTGSGPQVDAHDGGDVGTVKPCTGHAGKP